MAAKSRGRFPWSLRAPALASPCTGYENLNNFLEPYLILRFLTHKKRTMVLYSPSCRAAARINQTIYINEGRCNYRQCVGMTHSILSAQKPWLGRTERYRHICSFRAAPGMVLGEFPAWRKPFFSKELT